VTERTQLQRKVGFHAVPHAKWQEILRTLRKEGLRHPCHHRQIQKVRQIPLLYRTLFPPAVRATSADAAPAPSDLPHVCSHPAEDDGGENKKMDSKRHIEDSGTNESKARNLNVAPGTRNNTIYHNEKRSAGEAKLRAYVQDKYPGASIDGDYVNTNTNILMTCPQNHKCEPRPHDVLKGGRICAKCDDTSNEKRRAAGEIKFRDYVKRKYPAASIDGDYENSSTKILMTCPQNHQCKPTPSYVLAGGRICAKCHDPPQEKKRLAGELKFRDYVKGKYPAASIEGKYVNSETPITMTCPQGHSCRPLPRNVLSGGGICAICPGERRRNESQRTFREYLAQNHPGAVIDGKYINVQTPISMRCPVGHNCYPRPAQVLRGGGICLLCARIGEPRRREYELKFHAYVQQNHPGASIDGKYVNNRTKISMTCPEKHPCNPRPANVVRGRGICIICVSSKGEKKFGELLRGLSNSVESPFIMPDLPDRKFDFKIGACLFEFDGPQHYGPSEYFGGLERFTNYQRPRDLEMTRVALDNEYRLVRVHYDWIYKSDEKKIAFIREALASSEPLIVSCLRKYTWLNHFGPVELSVGGEKLLNGDRKNADDDRDDEDGDSEDDEDGHSEDDGDADSDQKRADEDGNPEDVDVLHSGECDDDVNCVEDNQIKSASSDDARLKEEQFKLAEEQKIERARRKSIRKAAQDELRANPSTPQTPSKVMPEGKTSFQPLTRDQLPKITGPTITAKTSTTVASLAIPTAATSMPPMSQTQNTVAPESKASSKPPTRDQSPKITGDSAVLARTSTTVASPAIELSPELGPPATPTNPALPALAPSSVLASAANDGPKPCPWPECTHCPSPETLKAHLLQHAQRSRPVFI
jgi:hypothetical protein